MSGTKNSFLSLSLTTIFLKKFGREEAISIFFMPETSSNSLAFGVSHFIKPLLSTAIELKPTLSNIYLDMVICLDFCICVRILATSSLIRIGF